MLLLKAAHNRGLRLVSPSSLIAAPSFVICPAHMPMITGFGQYSRGSLLRKSWAGAEQLFRIVY